MVVTGMVAKEACGSIRGCISSDGKPGNTERQVENEVVDVGILAGHHHCNDYTMKPIVANLPKPKVGTQWDLCVKSRDISI